MPKFDMGSNNRFGVEDAWLLHQAFRVPSITATKPKVHKQELPPTWATTQFYETPYCSNTNSSSTRMESSPRKTIRRTKTVLGTCGRALTSKQSNKQNKSRGYQHNRSPGTVSQVPNDYLATPSRGNRLLQDSGTSSGRRPALSITLPATTGNHLSGALRRAIISKKRDEIQRVRENAAAAKIQLAFRNRQNWKVKLERARLEKQNESYRLRIDELEEQNKRQENQMEELQKSNRSLTAQLATLEDKTKKEQKRLNSANKELETEKVEVEKHLTREKHEHKHSKKKLEETEVRLKRTAERFQLKIEQILTEADSKQRQLLDSISTLERKNAQQFARLEYVNASLEHSKRNALELDNTITRKNKEMNELRELLDASARTLRKRDLDLEEMKEHVKDFDEMKEQVKVVEGLKKQLRDLEATNKEAEDSRSSRTPSPRTRSESENWSIETDPDSGQRFYFNRVTEESTWDTPRELKRDAADSKPNVKRPSRPSQTEMGGKVQSKPQLLNAGAPEDDHVSNKAESESATDMDSMLQVLSGLNEGAEPARESPSSKLHKPELMNATKEKPKEIKLESPNNSECATDMDHMFQVLAGSNVGPESARVLSCSKAQKPEKVKLNGTTEDSVENKAKKPRNTGAALTPTVSTEEPQFDFDLMAGILGADTMVEKEVDRASNAPATEAKERDLQAEANSGNSNPPDVVSKSSDENTMAQQTRDSMSPEATQGPDYLDALVKLQAITRGAAVRSTIAEAEREIAEMEEIEREAAAVTLQAITRGNRERNRLRASKEKDTSIADSPLPSPPKQQPLSPSLRERRKLTSALSLTIIGDQDGKGADEGENKSQGDDDDDMMQPFRAELESGVDDNTIPGVTLEAEAVWGALNARATPSGRKVGMWEELVDPESEEVYYHNRMTNESSWEKPQGFERRAGIDNDTTRKSNTWEQLVTPKGTHLYWYNWANGEERYSAVDINDLPETIQEGKQQLLTKDNENHSSTKQLKRVPTFTVPSTPNSRNRLKVSRLWDVVRQNSKSIMKCGQWIKLVENHSQEYFYFNSSTGDSVWDKPDAWDDSLAEPFVEELVESRDTGSRGNLEVVAKVASKAKRWRASADARIKSRNWSCVISAATEHCLYEYNWTTGEIRKSLNFSSQQVKEERRLYLRSTRGTLAVAQQIGGVLGDEMAGMTHLWKNLQARAVVTGDINEEWQELLDERTGDIFYYSKVSLEFSWEHPLHTDPAESLETVTKALGIQIGVDGVPQNTPVPLESAGTITGSKRALMQRSGSVQSMRNRSASISSTGSAWKKIESLDDGGVYYFNKLTGESQWEAPPEFQENGTATVDPLLTRSYSTRAQGEYDNAFQVRESVVMSPKGNVLFDFGQAV